MTDHNAMKARLEQMLAELTSELNELGIHNPAVAEDWIATPDGVATGEADPNVSADRAEDWEQKRVVLTELEARFNNVNRAIAKFDAGTYGVCEISGEAIEADRLEANPAARTCKAHINDEQSLPV